MTPAAKAGGQSRAARWLPWALALLLGLWLGSKLRSPNAADGFDYESFGRLPVLQDGRIKPIDTVARNSLLLIRGKQTLRHEGSKIEPVVWLLQVLSGDHRTHEYPVFAVDNPEISGLMRMKHEGRPKLSFAQFGEFLPKIEAEAAAAGEVSAKLRSAYQRDVLRLYQSLLLFHKLTNTMQPAQTEDLAAELARFEANLPAGLQAMAAREKGQEHDKEAFQTLVHGVKEYRTMAQNAIFNPIPGTAGKDKDWIPMGEAIMKTIATRKLPPAVAAYAKLLTAYREGQAQAFNDAVKECGEALAPASAGRRGRLACEQTFNRIQPFYQAMICYVLVFLLAAVGWLKAPAALNRCAFFALVLGFVVHTLGFLARIYIQGYAPVTNLYSSAIGVGWVAVLLGVVLERLYRNGLGNTMSALVGFCTLVVAHHLTLSGDTMEMMRAVLDSNFWLATHVITITVGYGGVFLAGGLGVVYILRGVLTRSLDEEAAGDLTRMTYGIVCFGLLFSFIGTVLGGIWADQSWGRFWGWDPKENGALLIVMWLAIMLHARWAGMIRQRGLMLMAVYGNVVTAFSWFGVNLMGVGLHAYGFTGRGAIWLKLFIVSQLLVIAIGSVPGAGWRSAAALADARPGKRR